MKKLMMISALLLTAFVHTSANAWVHNKDVKINKITHWNNNGPIYFQLSNGKRCFVPEEEENLYSLMLMAYLSEKSVEIHCFDEQESRGGIKGHRVHRVVL